MLSALILYEKYKRDMDEIMRRIDFHNDEARRLTGEYAKIKRMISEFETKDTKGDE